MTPPLASGVLESEAERSRRFRFDAVSWLTVYIFFLFGVPSRLVVGPLGSAGAISLLLGLASMGLWLLVRVGASRPTLAPPDPLRVALSLFLFSVGVSYALAMSRPISTDEISPADVALLALASWSGTLLIARDGTPSRSRLDTLTWRAALAGGLLAALGFAQFLTKQPLVDMISIPGLTATQSASTFFRDGRIRPFGTSIHPLEYGTIMTMLLPLALHVAFHLRTKPLLARWWPALAIGGIVAISSSRAAYLSATIAIAICMVGWTKRQRRIIISLTVGGVLTLMVIIPRLITSILNLFLGINEDPSIESRTDSFTVAWAFLVQHPLFGRGAGTFLPKYRVFDNEYLLLLVTVGVVGTALFGGLLLVAFVQMVRSARRAGDLATRDLAVSFAASIAAGASSLAFFDAFAFPMTMGTLFLVLGMSGNLSRDVLRSASIPAAPLPTGTTARRGAAARWRGPVGRRAPAAAEVRSDPT